MMYVIHLKLRKRAMLASAAVVVMCICAAFLLPGCRSDAPEPIPAATEEQRQAYLSDLGWSVNSTPVETMDLQLPQTLNEGWLEYAKLQDEQNLPFSNYAGQTVRRFTYTVTNYPGIPQSVQINLYVCEDQLIGGDVISLGENGFQTGLSFPQT